MNDTVTISRLGHQGDGIGDINGKAVFVPFSLPGEVVTLAGGNARKDIKALEVVSPERVQPFCKHFGICGGCQLQHMEQMAYLKWKTSLLVEAFAREGIDISPEPIRTYQRTNRRRAVMNAIRGTSGFVLGFSERGGSETIDIRACPILVPAVNDAIGDIHILLAAIAPKKGDTRINLLECDNGLDLAFSFGGQVSDKAIREMISSPAANRFIRLSVNNEIVLESQKPILKIGIAGVYPPPEAFVQASKEAEQDMGELVANHLAKCKKVADLFSGFGTFALRLAERSQVFAAESSEPALLALNRAWRETGGKLKALTHEKRDLFRRPMNVKDLKYFDGAVFDPPRAGAEAQARELAKSPVKKIAAVSCSPQTLARDVKILLDGGFKIVSVTPLDQFAHTPHLEAVVLLER